MQLLVQNFRSIREQTLTLAPITVLYGPNGAGKSTFLYALLTLRNIVLNPNQSPPGFFNYQFTSLGGLPEVTFDHDLSREIGLSISFPSLDKKVTVTYSVYLKDTGGSFRLEMIYQGSPLTILNLPVSFPYTAAQQTQESFILDNHEFVATWNGLVGQIQPKGTGTDSQQLAAKITATLNAPSERLRCSAFVPLRRGFVQPIYSPVSVSPWAIAEAEVATLLVNDKHLEYRVSLYLGKIFNRDLRVRPQIGTTLFSLDSIDRQTGIGVEIVNDGFGVNQVVYLLARALARETDLVLVEEPEIHLHPSAVRRLAQAMVQIVHEAARDGREKRFLLSTHSEALVTAFLAQVAAGHLKPEDLACYLVTKEGKETRAERQEVNARGQIAGGLRAFMEGELEDLRALMGVRRNEQ
jgi:energy-coupling factor transporter ATP-binding protein EcfA2